MASPFVYEEPLTPDALVDREAELARLADRLGEQRNSRLEGPRRYGKTSLIRAALAAAEKQGLIAIEVNFLGCVSAADVAARIETAYSEGLDGTLRRWFDGLVRTFKPVVSAAPVGVGVRAELTAQSPGLLERLALPRQVQERSGRQCAIAFDEFQEVARVAPELPGVFRSELERHSAAAGYIFSGSHPGLMRELFADRRHAFFAQASPVTVGPLPPVALADHITRRFADHRRDPGAALGPLLDACAGHPQRAMLLAHHLFEATKAGGQAGIDEWAAAEATARREAAGEIQFLWSAATVLEHRVLKVIAQRDVALTGADAARRFALAKSGSTATAVDRLVGEGHLMADDTTRTGWRLVDPFLEAWLREN